MATENTAPPHSRVAVGRYPDRGHYDFETIAEILDAGLVCHAGVAVDGQPVVIPTIYGRIAKSLYIHGSVAARWMRASASARVCVTVSILDALVLARSAYNHSLNYRSAVIMGTAELVADEAEKIEALRAIVEHVCPGRWNDVRHPNAAEVRATTVLRLPIREASAKIRTGPPVDAEADLDSPAWAGLIPLHSVRGAPVPDPGLRSDIRVPAYCGQTLDFARGRSIPHDDLIY